MAAAGGRRNEMNLEAAGREFLKQLPQERMLSGRSELAEIELRGKPGLPALYPLAPVLSHLSGLIGLVGDAQGLK